MFNKQHSKCLTARYIYMSIRVALSQWGKNESDKFNCATLRNGSNHNKKIRAKYFDDCIIFRGVPQALKFNIENAMACITSQVYFREISFSLWNNMVDKGHGMQ